MRIRDHKGWFGRSGYGAVALLVLVCTSMRAMAQGVPTVDNATGPTSDSPTTATLWGQVTATNGAAPSVVQIYFGNNNGGATPSSWDTNFVIASWSEGVAFSNTVSNLYYGETYYYSVYASNTYGEVWSTVTDFVTGAPVPPTAITTTAADNMTDTSADVAGILDATNAVFTVYAYYSTNSHATAQAWLDDAGAFPPVEIGTYTNVTGQPVTGTLENLLPDTQYTYTLMATNAATSIWASEVKSFNTTLAPGTIRIQTGDADTITDVGARLNATLDCPSTNATVIAYWWITGDSTIHSSASGPYSDATASHVSQTVSDLAPQTSYSFTFLATNATDSIWAASTNTFMTHGKPEVDNASGPSSRRASTATLTGQVTATNGVPLDVVRIYFGDNDGGMIPFNWDTNYVFSSVSEGVAFSQNVTGLLYGKTYYYTVYASNTYGEAWSTVTNFTTWSSVATLIYEPFNYATGNLNGKSGATGLGAWSGEAFTTVASGSLSYGTTLATTGNKTTLYNENTYNYVSTGTTLSNSGLLAHGQTLWFSILWNFTTTGNNVGSGFAIGNQRLSDLNVLPLATSGNAIGFYTASRTSIGAATWTGTSAASRDAMDSVSANTTKLIVGQIIWGADSGALDTINLYMPDSALNLGSVTSTKTAVLDQSGFNVISLATRKASNGGVGESADEIRFGATYEDVVVLSPPTISNTGVANVEVGSADLGGILNAKDAVFTVYAYWSTNNCANPAVWTSAVADGTAFSMPLGTYTNVTGQAVTGSVANLRQNTPYYYTMMATNPVTSIWGSPNGQFTTKKLVGTLISFF